MENIGRAYKSRLHLEKGSVLENGLGLKKELTPKKKRTTLGKQGPVLKRKESHSERNITLGEMAFGKRIILGKWAANKKIGRT